MDAAGTKLPCPGNIGDVSTLAQDDTTLPALDASSIPGTPPLSQSVSIEDYTRRFGLVAV